MPRDRWTGDLHPSATGSPASVHDFIVIGSGFGGSLVAHRLVQGGARVLLLERGSWAERGQANQHPVQGFFQRSPAYTTETVYAVQQRRTAVLRRWKNDQEGICACVGGPSLSYGGVAFRFREEDFAPGPEIVADSGRHGRSNTRRWSRTTPRRSGC